MEKSIKQITKTFETFATGHKIISDFKSNVVQKNFAQNWKYPLMYCVTGSANFQPGQVRLGMDIYFLDLPGSEENYTQKLSDMLKITDDFYTYFNTNEASYGFYFSDDVVAEPVILAFEDTVIGYRIPITIQVKMMNNETEIPI